MITKVELLPAVMENIKQFQPTNYETINNLLDEINNNILSKNIEIFNKKYVFIIDSINRYLEHNINKTGEDYTKKASDAMIFTLKSYIEYVYKKLNENYICSEIISKIVKKYLNVLHN